MRNIMLRFVHVFMTQTAQSALVNGSSIIEERLARWVELVQAMRSYGITQILECGPGKVLSGAIKRIDPEMPVANVHDPATLTAVRDSFA